MAPAAATAAADTDADSCGPIGIVRACRYDHYNSVMFWRIYTDGHLGDTSTRDN